MAASSGIQCFFFCRYEQPLKKKTKTEHLEKVDIVKFYILNQTIHLPEFTMATNISCHEREKE